MTALESIRARERHLLRAILFEPDKPWSAAVSTAVAWMARDGESELGLIANAMTELIVRDQEINVGTLTARLNATYGNGETYYLRVKNMVDSNEDEPLPLSCLETDALDLIKYYRGKNAWRLVAKAQADMQQDYSHAVERAKELREELQSL